MKPLSKPDGQFEMFDAAVTFRADDSTKFSPELSELAKEEGMHAAKVSRAKILAVAKELAEQLAIRHGVVNIDDVQAVLIQWGHHPSELGNAAGSVFRGEQWECVGFVASNRVSNHTRFVRNWRLKG